MLPGPLAAEQYQENRRGFDKVCVRAIGQFAQLEEDDQAQVPACPAAQYR